MCPKTRGSVLEFETADTPDTSDASMAPTKCRASGRTKWSLFRGTFVEYQRYVARVRRGMNGTFSLQRSLVPEMKGTSRSIIIETMTFFRKQSRLFHHDFSLPINNRRWVDAVFLDIPNACDKIKHKKTLAKALCHCSKKQTYWFYYRVSYVTALSMYRSITSHHAFFQLRWVYLRGQL